MSERITARAKLKVEQRVKEGSVALDINVDDVTQRAMRCCPTGSAACGFAGVELGTVIEDGQQSVNTLCSNIDACAMQSDRLQEGMNRLSESATPVVIAR